MKTPTITEIVEYASSFIQTNNNSSPLQTINRAGNKHLLANNIIKCFPPHTYYIEPFFGSGGLYLNIQEDKLCNSNALNDLDGEVINYFNVMSDAKLCEVFLEKFLLYCDTQDNWLKCKNYTGDEPVERAFTFFTITSKSVMRLSSAWDRCITEVSRDLTLLKRSLALSTLIHLRKAKFFNLDYVEFFKKLGIDKERNKSNTFAYCDPPYIDTNAGKHYNSKGWSIQDTQNLINILNEKGFKYAISERKTDITMQIAKDNGLTVIELDCSKDGACVQRNRQEILMVNYAPPITTRVAGDLFD